MIQLLFWETDKTGEIGFTPLFALPKMQSSLPSFDKNLTDWNDTS